MLRTNRISAEEVRREEENSAIPLASYGDKILTVSCGSDFWYRIHQNGKLVYQSTNAGKAIQSYNETKVIKTACICRQGSAL
jgi:hypothetical protein